MMAWSPIIVFAALMIGYPLVQIAVIRFRRPYRIKFRNFINDLLGRHTSPAEHMAIAKLMTDSRGYWVDPVAHLMLPFITTVEVLRGGRPHDPEELEKALRATQALLQAEYKVPKDAGLWSDPELDRIMMMSMKLRIVNSPISFFIGALLSLPAITLARVVNNDPKKPKSLAQDIVSRFAATDRAIFN